MAKVLEKYSQLKIYKWKLSYTADGNINIDRNSHFDICLTIATKNEHICTHDPAILLLYTYQTCIYQFTDNYKNFQSNTIHSSQKVEISQTHINNRRHK